MDDTLAGNGVEEKKYFTLDSGAPCSYIARSLLREFDLCDDRNQSKRGKR
jgi:hypothetical protein